MHTHARKFTPGDCDQGNGTGDSCFMRKTVGGDSRGCARYGPFSQGEECKIILYNFSNQLRTALDDLRLDRPETVGATVGIETLRVLEAIYQSQAEGRRVHVER